MEGFIISSAIVFGFGWWQIRRRNVHVHRLLMLTGSILAALFFITYVFKTFAIGDTMFGGPKNLAAPYQLFLQTHSILATVAGIIGVVTLVYAFKARFRKHRRVGPWTVSLWFITAATGLTVFLMLYVIYPPGPTANIWKAWIG
ncbi:DUF420 domain-containing protein [Alicyclobacillus sp. SO9]|nr:DUF420 domain-containing protein [Alicyclobacillus sp. SO9]